MARIYLDVNILSQHWFKTVMDEIREETSVRFSYSLFRKSAGEAERCKKLLDFLKIMSAKKRVDWADPKRVEQHVGLLESQPAWCFANGCDDAHLFATVFEKPVVFVFSLDGRMAKCRSAINKVMDNRYCNFAIISSEQLYKSNRVKVLRG